MPSFGALAPFRIRSYRFQWPADLLTSWAFEMETLVLGWYVLVETNSVVMLTVFGALLYGGTLIAPIVGVWSDRIGHRTMLSSMRALYALVAATVMVLAFTGTLHPTIVLVLARRHRRGAAVRHGAARRAHCRHHAAGVADRGDGDRAHHLRHRAHFRRADRRRHVRGDRHRPDLCGDHGVLSARRDPDLEHRRAELGVAPRHAAAEAAATKPSPWHELREGIVLVWNTPRLLAIVWYALLFNFAVFPLTNGLMPYAARDVYHIDQTGLGYLVASVAFGAFVGSIFMTRSGMRMELARIMIVAAVIWHILVLIFAQMDTLWAGIVMLVLCGVAQSLTMVCHTVILLSASSPSYRGRIMGVRMLAIYSLPVGLLIAGVLIGWIGYRATASLYAIVGLVFTILIAVKWRASLWQARTLPKELDRHAA